MIELDNWQKEILWDESKYVLLCKGRQIGGTSTYAEKAAKRMVEIPTRILVGSITEDQAKLVIVMVREILEEKYPEHICTGTEKPTLDRIRLKNGSEIRSRPVGTMGDSFRGFTADVNWLNEASKWPELAFISIMPTLMTTGGDIWMDSTPFGKKGFFYKAFENKEGLWKKYYKSSEDVIFNRTISGSWTEDKREKSIKFLADQKKEMSTLQYGQEYLGLFLEDLRQFFSDELIEKCCVLTRGNPISIGGKKYLGCDLARQGGDQITWEIIERVEDFYEQKEAIAKTHMFLPEVVRDIISVAKIWDVRKIGIDAGAGTIGVSVLDVLMETELKRKVVALNNRDIALDSEGEETQALLKEDMYYKLLALMESGKIRLLDDPEVKLSLKSIQMEFIKSSSNRTNMRVWGQYGHHVEGIVRALWLAVKDTSLGLWCR